ncbi:MAG: alpha/beta fold hydrolase [Burkholderiales bacterium]|nr:alpha/beta fold hydrolase [Burkholderiales bacterium]MDE2454521.1 alpha/beta fold hydrolase [Burkholderiales bacterium]
MPALLLRFVGVLLLATAIALALSQAPDRPLETLVARWAPPPSDFTEVEGQFVHYRDEGPRADATPLVLLHGLASSLHTWEGWVARLKQSHRVITLDLPGCGLSGPNPRGDYRDAADARFVLALLDHLGVRRFEIGGNSLGGEIAWHIALLAPQRVARLVLVDSAGLPFEGRGVALAWGLARIPGIGLLFDQALPRPLVEQALRSVYGHPERVTRELVDRYDELLLREGNRRALIERLRQHREGADAAQVATLNLPTLILWGGRDTLIPPAVGRRFQAAIAGSRLVVFDDLGHVPQEEDPGRTVAPVLAFLDGR